MLIIWIPYKSGAKSGAYYDTYLLGVEYPFSFCLVHRIILNISRFCGIIIKSSGSDPMRHLGVAQLVARYLGVVEAASSSLVTQTISSVHNRFKLWTLDIFLLMLTFRLNIELF